jgi:N utilization substance protein B
MPSRQKSRQRALQILYLLDMRQADGVQAMTVDDAVRSFFASLADDESGAALDHDEFAEQLVRGTISNRDTLDQMIGAHSEHWRVERMAVVDRNILRLASYEMTYLPTPAPVVIDQALELAAKFSSPESVGFLNGVLDAIHHGARKDEPTAESGHP